MGIKIHKKIKMIYIASDHAGIELKTDIIDWFKIYHTTDIVNLGTDTTDSVDYPDFAHALCSKMTEDDFGILICGTGIGMSMVANKYPHIRCALILNECMAEMARKHNNANVLALGERMLDSSEAINLIDIFINTTFDGGRHQRRIDKIAISENVDLVFDSI